MTDKEIQLKKALEKCDERINRTKSLISYHKDILKMQEKKRNGILAKIEKEKMDSLFSMIHKGGLDIDSITQAVSSGQLAAKEEKTKIENDEKTAVSADRKEN